MNVEHLPVTDISAILALANAGDADAIKTITKRWNREEVPLYLLQIIAEAFPVGASVSGTDSIVTLTYRLAGTAGGVATAETPALSADGDLPALTSAEAVTGKTLTISYPYLSLSVHYSPETQSVDVDPTAQLAHNGLIYRPFPATQIYQSPLPSHAPPTGGLYHRSEQSFSVSGSCFVEITVTTTRAALANLI